MTIMLNVNLAATKSQVAAADGSRSRILDELVDHYLCWQDECVTVRSAYEQWRSSPGHERRLAHATYVAALDREESAARAYADLSGVYASLPSEAA
jgi:hypothetical protein